MKRELGAGGRRYRLSPRIERDSFTFTPRPPPLIWFAAEDLIARVFTMARHHIGFLEYAERRPLHPSPVPAWRSDGAQPMVGNDVGVEVEVRNFAGEGRPVLLGITGRLEIVDAPGRVADFATVPGAGLAMTGNRIAIAVDRPMETVEAHPPSVNSVDVAGVMVDCSPPRPAMD